MQRLRLRLTPEYVTDVRQIAKLPINRISMGYNPGRTGTFFSFVEGTMQRGRKKRYSFCQRMRD